MSLCQSILEPDAYVVPEYPTGLMYSDYAAVFERSEIEALVSYVLSLAEFNQDAAPEKSDSH